jgi:hypothetical protein
MCRDDAWLVCLVRKAGYRISAEEKDPLVEDWERNSIPAFAHKDQRTFESSVWLDKFVVPSMSSTGKRGFRRCIERRGRLGGGECENALPNPGG